MQLELLDLFETPSPTIPPRSRLISLPPRGVGSAYCEALISYLTRLAEAHVVRPNILAKSIIVPLTKIRLETSSCNFNNSDSRTINSYVNYAIEISRAIETLTLQKDLKNLTFIPWGELLDQKGSRLLRDHVGICKECLDEMEKEKSGIYYPLIWYLRYGQICSRHKRWLEDACPACGGKQSFVAHHAMLGYCTHCGAWLGTNSGGSLAESNAPTISEHDQFMVAALEQMIENNPTIGEIATHSHFVERLSLYASALTSGNISAFERRLGFNRNVVVNWIEKLHRPRIDLFLELCFRLGQMPIEFLTADIPSDLSSSIGQFEIAHSATRRKLTEAEHREIEAQLQALLESPSPPTRARLGEMLSVKSRFLTHHFPELVCAISSRRRQLNLIRSEEKRSKKIARAKAATEELFTQQRPISRRKLWAAVATQGLTFADPQTRRAVREVIEEHQQNNDANNTHI